MCDPGIASTGRKSDPFKPMSCVGRMFGKRKQKQQQQVPDISVRTHESGYIMRTGEHAVLGQEATSPEGNGWMLATNKALFFIHHSRGIYLYLDHYMITLFANKNGKITVKWLEKDRQFQFQMRLKDGFHSSDEVAGMLNTQFQYSGVAFEHVDLTDAEIDEAREDRLGRVGQRLRDLQNVISDLERKDRLDQDEKDRLKRLQFHKTVDAGNKRCMEAMPFVRSTRIPAHVPLTAIWNDCYFDSKRKLYVTFRRFRNGLGSKTLANQKKLNLGGKGTVFPTNEVDFCYGYPALKMKKDGYWTASLLCTLSEEMITDELVLALLNTHTSWENKEEMAMGYVWYETEAPRWIGGSFFKFTDAEREKVLKYTPWLKTTNDPEIPWIKPYKIVQATPAEYLYGGRVTQTGFT